MLKGRELNIPPWADLTSIHVIQGNPTISPQLMLALIQRSGQLEDIKIEGDAQKCAVTMKRKGQSPYTVTFSLADAGLMGLKDKQNWKAQPAVMLKWRAVSACARVVFADILLGMYTTEEINPDQGVSEEGEIIDFPVEKTPPTPSQESTEAHEPEIPSSNGRKDLSTNATETNKTAPISGETTEGDETHALPPEKPVNGRPWLFLKLKDYITKRTEESTAPDAPITGGQRKAMFTTMGRVFEAAGVSGDALQKRFLCELFDVESRSLITSRQLEVLNKWVAKDAAMAAREVQGWLEAREPKKIDEPLKEEEEAGVS